MALKINKTNFTDSEQINFERKLASQLRILEQLIDRPGFGHGMPSFGAELEMYLVDNEGKASHRNQELLHRANHPQLQLELNRYNLEYNLNPVPAAAQPFNAMEAEINSALQLINKAAMGLDNRAIAIGILPTLSKTDFHRSAISEPTRYQVLAKQISELRNSAFDIDISAEESLALTCDTVAYEGANTSFQVHWRVNPEDFVDVYNALQLITPLVVAVAANSPTLLGKMLWDETRIALFKQSIDYRSNRGMDWRRPSRVSFGNGWLRQSAVELFAESVALFSPLIPIEGEENSEKVWKEGGTPKLEELRLHHGTIWNWNRAVYDPVEGGHLRIEMRALPAGPTAVDMVANCVFMIGLANYMKPKIRQLVPAMPFNYAEYNFYRAAQQGLDAKIIWPDINQHGPKEYPLQKIAVDLIESAAKGLVDLGVEKTEVNPYLEIIAERLERKINGARWQRLMIQKLASKSREYAMKQMLARYIEESETAKPVTEWSLNIG